MVAPQDEWRLLSFKLQNAVWKPAAAHARDLNHQEAEAGALVQGQPQLHETLYPKAMLIYVLGEFQGIP